MNKNEKKERVISFTESKIAEWHQELQGYQQQQMELNQKIMTLHQRIQVASQMIAEQIAAEGGVPVQQVVHHFVMPMMPNNTQNPAPASNSVPQKTLALPDIIMGFFPTGIEKKTKQEIKKAIKDTGLNKLGANDAYFYTTMKRLVDKGMLIRNGDFYSRKVL